MPPLPGFTDNPFRTRADLIRAAKALITPLEQFRSPLGARVKVRPSTVAAFDDVAAQLEGFSRPWLVIAGVRDDDALLDRWCRGLESGVDRDGEEYWGDLGDFDQRMVEMESICLALLSAPESILPRLSEKGKEDLKSWLSQINHHTMPANNWRWFRIFVNLTLHKVLSVSRDEVQGMMDADFSLLDSFYLGKGWSSDGPWGEERKQADYYSGSFAMQFAQLMYVRLAGGDDERVKRYRQQAREFAAQYWRYFDIDGAAIPFGRSMTYRFAFAAFWVAAALAEVDLPAPVSDIGTVKGLILRHLRWWAQYENMFNSNGVMNIGFTYPNMYLSEDYNSPQSVYWCLKSLIIMALPDDSTFWKCEELPHPLARGPHELDMCRTIWPPRHIIDSSPEHHFMLSSGQMTTKPHKAKDAKYGKLAYSSAFGFSVPSGTTLGQLAPDSTLCLSTDDGETWKVRANPGNVRLENVLVGNELVQGLSSSWRPWKRLDLEVETTLVPLAQHAPGWHVRIHKVQWSHSAENAFLGDGIQFVDGSFAIPSLTAAGYHVSGVTWDDVMATKEGHCSSTRSALVRSEAGAGGIQDLSASFLESISDGVRTDGARVDSEGFVLRADPNTNLISPRTFIPCVKHHLAPAEQRSGIQSTRREAWVVSGVFAVAAQRVSESDISRLWNRKLGVVHMKSGAEDVLGRGGCRFEIQDVM